MAILGNADRVGVWAEFMDDLSARRGTCGTLAKADLRAAVNAIDDWVDTNAVLFNATIPLPARTQLTVRQKAELLLLVIRRRFEVA